MEAIPGKHSTDSLQKTAILRTSHVIRKALQSETWSLSGGDHLWLKEKYQAEKTCAKRQQQQHNNNNNNNNNNNIKLTSTVCTRRVVAIFQDTHCEHRSTRKSNPVSSCRLLSLSTAEQPIPNPAIRHGPEPRSSNLEYRDLFP